MTETTSSHGKGSFDRKYFRRFFNKYSESEFEIYYRWAKGWIRFLDKYLPLKNGKNRKVLELGSSMGYFSKALSERDFDVVATDVSSHIIQKAKKLQKDIDFQVVDIEKEIKVKGGFDFVFAFEVLEHLKNPEKALRNIYPKVKKGGYLVFSTPFPTKRSLADPTHINVHEETWWMELGKKVGFKKRKLVHATFVPYLYRLNSVFSIGFPLKSDIPFINSTAFYIFRK